MVEKKKIISILLIIMIGIVIPINIYANSYIWSSMQDLAINTSANISEEYTDDMTNPLKLDCGSAILIEQTTGKVLYSYKSHEQLKPASVTKVMSILLIMEAINSGKINYDTQIPCSENASSMGGSQIWLDQTETLTVDEMLKAICVVSANDCVMAMAEYIAGSEEGFVKMMDDKAKELGMNDTTFKNCHGIDEDGHVTSSYDISLMSRELLNKYPEVTKYTTIWNDSLRDGKSELVNTNKLVRNYNGCTGLKTGSTSIALYNLSASATRNNLSLIAVVLKAPTPAIRFSNAQKLLDYGFSNYSVTSFGKKGDVIKSVTIKKGTLSSVDAVLENDADILNYNGSSSDITQEIKLSDTLNAPILDGQKIGEVEFSMDGSVILTVNLVSNKTVNKLNFSSIFKLVFSKWFNLLR